MNEDIKLSKNIKLNSDALMKNLEVAEEKLKKGVKIKDALTEVDIMWYNMSRNHRDTLRSKLTPEPTEEYDMELDRLMKTYDTSKRQSTNDDA